MTTPPVAAPPPFVLETSQNRYLPEGGEIVDAILTVTATGDPGEAAGTSLIGFIVDSSASMRGGRMAAVRDATVAALDHLTGDDMFFVVTFSHTAVVVVPPTHADTDGKGRALKAVRALRADGGTAMSQGLAVARPLFARYPDAIGQAVFLTDGRNESDDPALFARELAASTGVFSADCWGVGTDWEVGEVQEIARTLLGRASLIPEPDGMAAAFAEAVGAARAKAYKDVRVRLWTPVNAQVAFFGQVSPSIEDYTARALPVGGQVRDYATGAWAPGESRDYHVQVKVPAGSIGEQMLAARPSIVFDVPGRGTSEVKAPDGRVFATWTTDDSLSSRLDAGVAHYTGQGELAEAIGQGLASRERGDEAAATQLLGRAVKIAHDSGNVAMTSRLRKVVEVIDEANGTVRLRRQVAKAATMDLQLESTTTRRARRAGGSA